MAVFEAMSRRRACTSRPAVAYRQSPTQRRHRRLMRGRLLKGGNLSGPVDDYLQPLCPLRVDAHKRRYLAVDSSEERFADFTAAFADPADWVSKGHLVVVTGDRGYGKTSLIQRCACWLNEQAMTYCKVVVVDLSDERWSETEPESERIRQTLEWMLDALRDALEPHEVTQIKSHTRIVDSFRDLGRVLGPRPSGNGSASQPIVLVVLLQGYPKPAEVAEYYSLARPGMFFFAELFESEDMRAITAMMPRFNRFTTNAHLLPLNVLKPGDADLLVDWIRREGGNWPKVPHEIVRDYFDSIITRYKVGMAELTKLAWGTLGVAAAEAAHEVTVNHIAQYYEQDKYEKTV